jgi:pyrroline-5-carboxylate reductase
MFQGNKVALVGSGAMGGAIIQVVLDKGLIAPEQLVATDALPDRCAELAARYGIETTTDNGAAVEGADVVILAIKPQVLPTILESLTSQIKPTALVLSIVAGAPTSLLVEGLQHGAVIRSMPNISAQVGEGMVVWTATSAVSEAQRAQGQAILQAMGHAVYVAEEKQLDMATAINGSGPAYVFLFMEAMVDAGVRLGFSRPVARELVVQTVLGAALFARQSGAHLAELRNKVTSPGGTTAEALYQLEDGGLRVLVYDAIQAAYAKSMALAGDKD